MRVVLRCDITTVLFSRGISRGMTSVCTPPAPFAMEEFMKSLFSTKVRFSVHVTGGGSQVLPWLFTVPGASACVLQGNVPYAMASLRELIGCTPEQYCSADTAAEMARAALRKSVRYILDETGSFSSLVSSPIFGISCTASLVSQVLCIV